MNNEALKPSTDSNLPNEQEQGEEHHGLTPDLQEAARIVEALLFAAVEPLSVQDLMGRVPENIGDFIPDVLAAARKGIRPAGCNPPRN